MQSEFYSIVSASARFCADETEFWALLNDALYCIVMEAGGGRCENCVHCRLYNTLTEAKTKYENEYHGWRGKTEKNTNDRYTENGKFIVS